LKSKEEQQNALLLNIIYKYKKHNGHLIESSI